jgi:hypothetical protein
MGRLTTLGSRLSRPAPRLAPPPKTADPFYLSSEWKAHRERRKLDPDYYAALSRRRYPGEKLILDHVHERRDGGDDFGETEWLTLGEHNAKTAKAKARRARSSR